VILPVHPVSRAASAARETASTVNPLGRPPHAPRVLVYEKLRQGTFIADELAAHGFDVEMPYGPDSTLLRHARFSEDDLIGLAQGFDAVLGISSARFTRRVFEALPQLTSVSKIGIGHDVIDLEAANELGVAVTNTPSLVEIDCVAEHAITLLLASVKRLDFYTTSRMQGGGWLDSTVPAQALRGRVLGLIGFGRIARAVARRLAGWGVEIIAFDITGVPGDVHEGVRMVTFDQLVTQSDFVSLHSSTQAGGKPILDAPTIARLKPGVIIVNTARGMLIEQAALNDALISGHVAVAAVDVLDPEPPVLGEPLLERTNLLATPHSASTVAEAEHDMELLAVTNLVELFRGIIPEALLTAGTGRLDLARDVPAD
jgi:D-3-phosphoglycerate dehydrogenase